MPYISYSLRTLALGIALPAILGAYLAAPHRAISQTTAPITGYLWSDTIGWISMDGSEYGVSIDSSGNLSGYAWSENAGWIKFNHGESFASGVAFLPDSASLIGYAWNDSLGWIPFGS